MRKLFQRITERELSADCDGGFSVVVVDVDVFMCAPDKQIDA